MGRARRVVGRAHAAPHRLLRRGGARRDRARRRPDRHDRRRVRRAVLAVSHPGVTFFEVDHPHTQADKRRRIAAAGGSEDGITFVTVDLSTDALAPALAAAGHDASRESLFLAEGLITYLSPEEIARLLDAVHAFPGRLVLTAVEAGADTPLLTRVIGGIVRHAVGLLGEPMRTRPPRGETARTLAEHGFTVLRQASNDESGYLSLQFEASA